MAKHPPSEFHGRFARAGCVGAMVLAGNGLALYRGDIQSDAQQVADTGRFGVIPWGYISVGASF